MEKVRKAEMNRTRFAPKPPARYHGRRRRGPFFEGWYYKLVSADEAHRYAVIPGIFKHPDPRRAHAFVQVLDGAGGAAAYHRYPVEAFEAASDRLDARVGPNRFTERSMHLDIREGPLAVSGDIGMSPLTPWPVTRRSPGVMGPYAWVPQMECNHGVLSFDHELQGSLSINDSHADFSGGRGYMEKDWGAAFPKGYVWMQSNHFEEAGTSLFGSIAIIPWMGSAFPGFIVGLRHEGVLYRFATYARSRTTELQITDDAVHWTMTRGTLRLEIEARRARGGLLLGPTREDMSSRVGETMQARLQVSLSGDAGVVFAGTGRNAGLEVQGDTEALLALQRRGA
jgi:hypothetical protein